MKQICIWLFGLLTLLAVSGCGKSTPPAPLSPAAVGSSSPTPVTTPTNTAVIARVNGQPISREVFEQRVRQFQAASAVVDSGVSAEDLVGQIEGQVLDGLIDQAIIDEAARDRGITISDETLREKIAQMQAGQDETAFNDWLALNNLTFDQFRDTLYDQLIAAEVLASVIAEASPAMDQVQASQILVSDPGQAQALLARLEAGEDFATLAETYSIDEATRQNGGQLGWFPQGLHFVPPQVEGVAFSLQPGQTSPVIESVLGYHIIKVEAREAARPLTALQLQQAQAVLFEDWLAQQRAAAVIERY